MTPEHVCARGVDVATLQRVITEATGRAAVMGIGAGFAMGVASAAITFTLLHWWGYW